MKALDKCYPRRGSTRRLWRNSRGSGMNYGRRREEKNTAYSELEHTHILPRRTGIHTLATPITL